MKNRTTVERKSERELVVTRTFNGPARLVFDFANTTNGLGRNSQDIQQGELLSMNLVQGAGRSRMVLNLRRSVAHEVAIDG